uniref:E3 ubiquitin-protein ligase parkin n=1 Tax=Strigamia maritima TaxID=126957 RepID=T1JC78_STRMM
MPDALVVNVKFNSSQYIQMNVDPKWTVKILKENLSAKIKVPARNIKLIFAGRELQNSVVLEDYEMTQQSIIHAVRTLKPSLSVETSESDPTLTANRIKLDFNSTSVCDETKTRNLTEPKKQINFYVYCSNPCKSLQPGKLRVRCNLCKQGTLTVSEDPCGWEDVLIPQRIEGKCQMESCEGKYAEFYFKCASHPSGEDETCVALNLIRTNIINLNCLICTENNDPVVVFPCESAHVICVECFKLYCYSRLNERQFVQDKQFGYTLPCPAACQNSLIEETHHFRLLGDEQYERYQRFGAEECLLQAGGVLCPVPGCGAGILPDPDCRKITCIQQGGQGCGFVFCRNCLRGFHLEECEESGLAASGGTVAFTIDATQADNSSWNANKSGVTVVTKPCPKCRTPTERAGGCMHMICTRPQCGFHWCWICQTEWTRDCMGDHWKTMTATNATFCNGTNDKISTISQVGIANKKRRVNNRLVPIKIYYFLHEGGGAISGFISLVAKRIGISVGLLGIINTITVSLALVAKPLAGGVIDKFGHQKIIWLFCQLVTVGCIFSLIFIPLIYTRQCTQENQTVTGTVDKLDRRNGIYISNFTANNCLSRYPPELHLTYQFWWLCIANVVAGIAKRLVEVIQTSVIYAILAEKHSQFGKQKIFGSLGYGLSFIIGGVLNQYLVTDAEGFQYDYSFYIFGLSMLLASVAICWFTVQPQPRPSRIIHDISLVFTKPRNCFLFVSIFFMGTFRGFLSTYTFWYLSELGASPLILGLAKGCQALIGEIPCLFISGWLIKKLDHYNVFSFVFAIQTVGFCVYALMDNVMLVFLTEILNGIIIGFFLPAATSYCALVAPPGTSTTLQGIFFAVYKGAGRVMGNLCGGFMYSAFGGRTTYLMFAVLSFACLLLNVIINLVFHHRKIGSLNIT